MRGTRGGVSWLHDALQGDLRRGLEHEAPLLHGSRVGMGYRIFNLEEVLFSFQKHGGTVSDDTFYYDWRRFFLGSRTGKNGRPPHGLGEMKHMCFGDIWRKHDLIPYT